MSTRSNIELYTVWPGNPLTKDVLLYHHSDGYPSWMGPELTRILDLIWQAMSTDSYAKHWWDAERVGAMMVARSADGLVPRFQPCLELHGDIEYLWRVYLGPTPGKFRLECFAYPAMEEVEVDDDN